MFNYVPEKFCILKKVLTFSINILKKSKLFILSYLKKNEKRIFVGLHFCNLKDSDLFIKTNIFNMIN